MPSFEAAKAAPEPSPRSCGWSCRRLPERRLRRSPHPRGVGDGADAPYNPPPMRKNPILSALALCLAAAVPALAFERVEIHNKEVVLGAITAFGSTHEYLIDVPRGGLLSLSLPKQKDSRLQGSMGLFDISYRSQSLLQIGKRKVQQPYPTTISARYRAIVQGVNKSVGLYVLKPKVKVQKKWEIAGRRSDLAPPGEIVFGALPGYDVSVKITWKGPDAVTIGSFTAPDGSDVTSASPSKQKASSSKQKGFRTTQFGDHRIVLDIPFSASQWTLSMVQTAKTPARALNLRPAHALAPQLDLQVGAGPIPAVIIEDEKGAGNEVLLTGNNTVPRVIGFLGGEPEGCELAALEGGSTPRFYAAFCGETHNALITIDERDEDRRILSYTVDPLEAPGGDGRTEFTEFVYDTSNRLQGWTELRRFDESGNTHRLVVSNIVSTGGTYTYTVHHTPPGGPTRRYDLIPFN